jgi:hypothetical protein
MLSKNYQELISFSNYQYQPDFLDNQFVVVQLAFFFNLSSTNLYLKELSDLKEILNLHLKKFSNLRKIYIKLIQ